MAITSEPSLRLVHGSDDKEDVAEDCAKTLVDAPLDAYTSSATSALGPTELAPVSGEIKTSWIDGTPTTTLIGVGALPALRAPNTRRKRRPNHELAALAPRLFVAPEVIEAVARVKDEPKVVVNLPESGDPDEPRRVELKIVPTPPPLEEEEEVIELDQKKAEAEPGKWQVFEDLGLAPKPITKKAQKLVVSTYRLLGFGILTLIVVVLVSYIANTAFYFLNHGWITPVALSPSDEKVVALQGQLAQQLNERDRLASELAQSERSIRAEQDFQLQFARAIRKDAAGRRVALDRVKELSDKAAATRAEIRSTNGDYSESTVNKMGKEYDAGLIDRNAMLAGKFQLAQISSANLSLAERQAEFDERAADLASQTQSLDAVLANKQGTAALSYDVLKIARDYETSKLAVAKEASNREHLKSSLERMETIINGIKESSYLRAATDGAQVALVPYANMKNASVGTPVYACKLSMVLCRKVGVVKDILSGEVDVKQPNRDSTMRGQMIEIEMSDETAAKDDVLFLGKKPLGI